jgi:hypothetical protein
MVVLPAASRPTIRMRISCLEKSLWNNLVNVSPIAAEKILLLLLLLLLFFFFFLFFLLPH